MTHGTMHFEPFRGGMGDAGELAALGRGYVAADLTVMGGPVPWNVYYGTNKGGELAGRFPLAFSELVDSRVCQYVEDRL